MEKLKIKGLFQMLRDKKLLVFVFIGIVSVPFLLDWFYGTGIPGSVYHNNFPAESWFSFLGSYFPAMLIGVLTIYQQQIIRKKDEEYKKLIERYFYSPDRNAEVFRYSPSNQRIGEWTYYDFKSSLETNHEIGEFSDEWGKGYIIRCSIHNIGKIGIKHITCDSIEWVIKSGEPYREDTPIKIKTYLESIGEARYLMYVFWTFQDLDNSIASQVALCMNNGFRKNPDYYTSYISLNVKIENDVGELNNINMKFRMQQCLQEVNPYKLQSVEEHYIPV